MSKIVQAVNSMITNAQHITRVMKGSLGKLYFQYKHHKWSILQITDTEWDLNPNTDPEYILSYYPGHEPLEILVNLETTGKLNLQDYMSYFTKTLGTREATESFADLYTTIRERLYGVDKVLETIIADDQI